MHTGTPRAHQLTRDSNSNNRQIQWLSHPSQTEDSGKVRHLDLAIVQLEASLEAKMGRLREEVLVQESYQMQAYRSLKIIRNRGMGTRIRVRSSLLSL